MWARLILSVAVRAYFARTRASYMRLPRPDGVKFVRADGPEPVSVLILGTDAASGWGVRSHELGLPGFFARALRQRLGHGVTVELAETPAGVVSDLVRLAAARSQWEVDAVLIVGGIADAAQLRDARQWRSGLETSSGSLAAHRHARKPSSWDATAERPPRLPFPPEWVDRPAGGHPESRVGGFLRADQARDVYPTANRPGPRRRPTAVVERLPAAWYPRRRGGRFQLRVTARGRTILQALIGRPALRNDEGATGDPAGVAFLS